MIDETHDPALRSWVASANTPGSEFPIQNLPLGVFRSPHDVRSRLGVAIGDFILDIAEWLDGEDLSGYMNLPSTQRRELRRTLSRVLTEGSPSRPLFHQTECQMLLPAKIGDYTDFYASIHHAMNAGKIFRPERPLLPNYKHVPIAYHGRASSIVVSGTSIRRPSGQLGEGQFGKTKELDYELEVAAFLGPGNQMGEVIPIGEAENHIVGICLLNDWSARDIQRWEAQPLGPFLSKSFATSISPWLITLEALEPFRTEPMDHDASIPTYLQSSSMAAFDITLEVWLRSQAMAGAVRVSQSRFKDMYWTFGQMIAHHSSNGCPLRPGDLIASGTVSGPEKQNCGCLLELTSNGRDPLYLARDETRQYLSDGDEVTFRGHCARDGSVSIGLGTCTGRIAL